MKNITLGRYLPLDTIIHTIDPRAKILALLVILVTVFFDSGFLGYGIIGVFCVSVVLMAKLTITYILKSLRPMMFMLIMLLVLNILIIKQGEILFTIGSFRVYENAVFQTIYVVVRLVLIISITTILTATTKPLDLTLGIESLLTPFKKIGFPAHEVAMVISIALRFIPTLMEETERIMKAQASRGVDFKEGRLKEKITAIISLIVPLFISAFQRAEDLADAMESRSYNPEAKRTRYKQLSWSLLDTISLGLSLSLMLVIIFISVVN
jgi:ABC-type cobalt transport system, permease component CbiQ and related transporters